MSRILAVFILIQLVRSCPTDHCVQYGEDDVVDNFFLSQYVIENITLHPPYNCPFWCAIKCSCLSFSQAKDGTHCLLNYESRLTAPQAAQQNRAYKYVGMKLLHSTKCDECQNFCCLSSPCLHGGQCTELCDHPHKRINCTCAKGFTGSLCQIDIDDCVGVQCLNGGTCKDQVNSYGCVCTTGYFGQRCESYDCKLNPCQNGGVCTTTQTTTGYTCACAVGYTGVNCETCSTTFHGYVTADNKITAYGVTGEVTNGNWPETSKVTLSSCAKVIALKGWDSGGGYAGMLGSFSNGVVTDTSWRCSAVYDADWRKDEFDDSSWLPAKSYGKHGVGPWRTLPNIASSALWIWTSDVNGNPTVYCRKRLQ